MQISQAPIASGHQVMALFADSALSFNLDRGATFADLASRLEGLCLWHSGVPTAISLLFAPTSILPIKD